MHLKVQKLHRDEDLRKKKRFFDTNLSNTKINKIYQLWITSTPFPPSYHQSFFLRPKQFLAHHFQSLANHRDFRSRYLHWKSVEQTTVSRKTDSVACPIRAISQRSMYLPGLVLLRSLRNISRSLPTELQPNRVQRNYDRSNSSLFLLPPFSLLF